MNILVNIPTIYWLISTIIVIVVVVALSWVLLRQYRLSQNAVQRILDTDSLTGHMSMHKFERLAQMKLQSAEPCQYNLISFDIDMFMTINTYYSTEKGTEVLCAISKTLEGVFEDEDTIFARKFADNFVILRSVGELPILKSIITHKVIPAVHEVMGEGYTFCMSTGSYIISDCTKKISLMIENADIARRNGKSEHKTTYKEFDSAMQKKYETKLDVTYRMGKALRENEFHLLYQPKIDFHTLGVRGVEALVRWQTKDAKTFYPNDFVPVFEQNGFIVTLDLYVFERVCRFIADNRNMKLPVISVNLSAKTFVDESLVYDLLEIIGRYRIDPCRIELEITETAMCVSEHEIMAKISLLKSIGFTISIDDFGAGVSSLNRLGKLDVDVLKMDKAFLDNNIEGSNNAIVIECAIDLAKRLGMKVVAEGVETKEQAIWLNSLGCDMAQGYFFEKPLQEEEFKYIVNTDKRYYFQNGRTHNVAIAAGGARVFSNSLLRV